MKKELLLLSCLISTCAVFGQDRGYEDYHPFIEKEKVWKVGHLRNEIIPDDYWTELFYLGEDTIISNVRCKKMMHGDNIYAGAVHETGMRVGYFAPDSRFEALLYDFGVEEGDIVTPLMDYLGGNKTYKCVITDVLTINNDGENLRCIFLSPIELDYQNQIFGVWVESVGSIVCPVADVPLIITPVGQFLDGCVVGEKELYTAGLRSAINETIQKVGARKTAIHDTPVQRMVNGQSLNSKCYDLSGRRINNGQWKMDNGQLPRGVYIKDGRKMVVK